ncbi:MAG TPA: SGNH/GDSL hydrolase family protein [Arsenophonus nasoniae]|uniref:SGNH/GDSL hydrolase family protein n=1 Tax=Arsenophonus nasoniae TaxID=638 RepID=UPI0038799F33
MQSKRFRNVIVFGDSLSDTGLMASSIIGKLASAFGAMTVNPTGRYSDCRNWTDHMFEAATGGESLMMASASISKKLTSKHQSFSQDSGWGQSSDLWFRYANYAVGGATGGIPYGIAHKCSLTTMKNEVNAFRKDFSSLGITDENFLFIVWFGANDLYTAGLPASRMSEVAIKIADKRRKELASIVGASNAHFIYINMGLPLSAARYQEMVNSARQKYQTSTNKDKAKRIFANVRQQINNFESGAMLFNHTLREITERNCDMYVDMASLLKPESMTDLYEKLHLLEGVQAAGTSNQFIDSCNYDIIMGNKTKVSTSDKAHPTDRVYRVVWQKICEALWEKGYTFGTLPVARGTNCTHFCTRL